MEEALNLSSDRLLDDDDDDIYIYSALLVEIKTKNLVCNYMSFYCIVCKAIFTHKIPHKTFTCDRKQINNHYKLYLSSNCPTFFVVREISAKFGLHVGNTKFQYTQYRMKSMHTITCQKFYVYIFRYTSRATKLNLKFKINYEIHKLRYGVAIFSTFLQKLNKDTMCVLQN